jgi:hypothetical protein
MKSTISLIILSLTLAGNSIMQSQAPAHLPRLKVDPGGHFLVTVNGEPFFWLGDTGWTLFQFTPAEMRKYMADRADKGFTVIQLMVIRHEQENYNGLKPFTNKAPVTLNEAYWRYIDEIIEEARTNGLYVCLYVMWGMDADTMFPDPYTGNYQYAKLIGQRYRDKSHVIWSVCGEYEKIGFYHDEQGNYIRDQNVSERGLELIRQIAQGLEEGHGGQNLMTIHPVTTSSNHFHNDPWLDFNQQQTWGQVEGNADRILDDYNKSPVKPVFNGEPGYEKSTRADFGYINASHMRNEAYTSLFSGGFGFTYGAQDIWNFGERETRLNLDHYLDYEGAFDMKHVRDLMESRPLLDRIPDQRLVTSAYGSKGSQFTPGNYRAATRASDGSYAFIYSTRGEDFSIDMSKISGSQVKAWWYNPRDGKCYDESGNRIDLPFGTYSTTGTMTFSPPGEPGAGRDWVLVLDDASRDFCIPGRILQGRPEE